VSEIIKLSSPATGDFWEIPILHEDPHLLALDKPAGLLVSPDRYDPARPNLMKLLHRDLERGAPWAKARGLHYLMNAHRLDFPTSGVLLLAKDKPALVALANQFGAEKPVKVYAALVRGAVKETSFECDAKLAPHPLRPAFMRVDPKNGKRARTAFSVREAFDGYLLLECRPWTGRTHQIRAHLKHLRLPLVGDESYGGPPLWLSTLKTQYRLKPGRSERPLMARAALHAEQLILGPPGAEENQSLRIEAPWPKDLAVAVKYLRRYAGR
jgi:23S rRNA pseudouridine955/2504/2580 synthase/23S rRNA pseudouridine1911/1915/1917 synthase